MRRSFLVALAFAGVVGVCLAPATAAGGSARVPAQAPTTSLVAPATIVTSSATVHRDAARPASPGIWPWLTVGALAGAVALTVVATRRRRHATRRRGERSMIDLLDAERRHQSARPGSASD